MPWSSGDAKRFKKDISPGATDKWAAIANKVLAETGDEGKAVRIANGSTRAAIKRRLNSDRGKV